MRAEAGRVLSCQGSIIASGSGARARSVAQKYGIETRRIQRVRHARTLHVIAHALCILRNAPDRWLKKQLSFGDCVNIPRPADPGRFALLTLSRKLIRRKVGMRSADPGNVNCHRFETNAMLVICDGALALRVHKSTAAACARVRVHGFIARCAADQPKIRVMSKRTTRTRFRIPRRLRAFTLLLFRESYRELT